MPHFVRNRRGVVAVEAALVLPLLLLLMRGVWEVGRLVQVQQLMTNAAREGARAASGGTINGTPVTVAVVQQITRDYLEAAGLPAAAVSGAVITLVNTGAGSWTDPVDAEPLDPFEVRVQIPAGAAFESLRLSVMDQLIPVNELNTTVVWASSNDEQVVVDVALPF